MKAIAGTKPEQQGGSVRWPRTGLVLPGGGARAAYQVGVLKAIARMMPPKSPTPFSVISGTSAGAINAASLAAHADRFRGAVRALEAVWTNFTSDQVYGTSPREMLRSSLHWLAALTLGGLRVFNPPSLLNNAPLRRLLEGQIPFERIQANIERGYLHAAAVTVSNDSPVLLDRFLDNAVEVDVDAVSDGKHVVIGAKMLDNPEIDIMAKNIALYHHERWDGSGYPLGLKGEAIPIEGRLMALADVYDALISRRCYKEPYSFQEAEQIILREGGRHFDPGMVQVFLELQDEFRQIATKYQEMEDLNLLLEPLQNRLPLQ